MIGRDRLRAIVAGASVSLGAALAFRAAETVTSVIPPDRFRSPPPHRRSSGSIVRPYQLTGNTPHQGAAEIERRRKRIEAAKAKAARSRPPEAE